MPLRIAMLSTFYPPYNFGGDGIGVRRLAVALADRGHSVTVIHDEDAYLTLAGREPAASPRDPRIDVVGLRSRLGMAAPLLTHQLGRPVVHGARLQKLLEGGDFDVTWYHNISLIGGPGVLAYGRGLKIYEAHEHWLVCPTHVLWRHNREVCDARRCTSCTLSYRRPPQGWRYTGALDRATRHVDAFIAKSEFSQRMHKQFGFGPEMQVIPYFLPDQPAEAPAHPARPYFLFVGRLEKIKGLQDVIPAFAGDAGPQLVIAGAGEFEPELRRLAEGMPRVRFVGRLEEEALATYYRDAMALIVPSVCYETFGIIIIEAFRNGTPVVARRIGPFPEIIARGGGLLFSDDRELHQALEAIAADGEYRACLAREARAAFEQHWREDVVMEAYLDLLRGAALAKGDARVLAGLEAAT